MTTINELFNGCIRPFENLNLSKSYFDMQNELGRILNLLEEKISEEDKDLFEKMKNQYMLISTEAYENVFTDGFSLGVRLTAECYENKQDR